MNNAYADLIADINREKTTQAEDSLDVGTMCLIRLMGKTGVCVGWLEDDVLKALLDYTV